MLNWIFLNFVKLKTKIWEDIKSNPIFWYNDWYKWEYKVTPKYQSKIKNNIFHYEILFLTELSSKIFNSNAFDWL